MPDNVLPRITLDVPCLPAAATRHEFLYLEPMLTPLPERIELDDLLLRPLVQDDRQPLIDQLGDLRVAEWLAAIRHPFGAQDADEIYAMAADPLRNLRALSRNGRMVGCLSLGHGIWFWLAPEVWGQGLMTRALGAALPLYFGAKNPPLIATCRRDNAASIALLAGLGFAARQGNERRHFHAAGQGFACSTYVMTPEQWHFLHPLRIEQEGLVLRPARQSDLPLLQHILIESDRTGTAPFSDQVPDSLSAFIEDYRHRGPQQALFVIEDDIGRGLAVALLGSDAEPRFLLSSSGAIDDMEARLGRLFGAIGNRQWMGNSEPA
ncbi:MAG: GNAT family N-acetyltransferase [Paracoccus sp. (in: a-proteobacteria)]